MPRVKGKTVRICWWLPTETVADIRRFAEADGHRYRPSQVLIEAVAALRLQREPTRAELVQRIARARGWHH